MNMEPTFSNICITLGFLAAFGGLLFAVIMAVFDIDFFFDKASRILVGIAICLIVVGFIGGIVANL